mmetsp:Transcript_14807/g.43895  ORF Transcript_14807/g.43895 Transcript_14807/m.43895 type:complete len:235 (+) Transcript_14807:721-1425(+)
MLFWHATSADLDAQAGAAGHPQRRAPEGPLDGRLRVGDPEAHGQGDLVPLLLIEHVSQRPGHHLHYAAVTQEQVEGVGQGLLRLQRFVISAQLVEADDLGDPRDRTLLHQQLLVSLLRVLCEKAHLRLLVPHRVRQRDHDGPHLPPVGDLAQGELQCHRLGGAAEQRVRVRGLLGDDLVERLDGFRQNVLLDFHLGAIILRNGGRHGCRAPGGGSTMIQVLPVGAVCRRRGKRT